MTDRRTILRRAALALFAIQLGAAAPGQAHGQRYTMATTTVAQDVASDALQPFRVDVPEADLVDLQRRIAATRFVEKETVSDQSQGVQLATIQELARYWGTDYDTRRVETRHRLNALSQYVTTIDGVDIHFFHVRSHHSNAFPLLVPHGWPGSVIELLSC